MGQAWQVQAGREQGASEGDPELGGVPPNFLLGLYKAFQRCPVGREALGGAQTFHVFCVKKKVVFQSRWEKVVEKVVYIVRRMHKNTQGSMKM